MLKFNNYVEIEKEMMYLDGGRTWKVLRTVLALGSIAGLSVGYFIAKAIDGVDNWLARRSWNGYCFG